METAIIVNGILVTVFSLGFLSYVVWLGFKVVRLSGELAQLEYDANTRVDSLERTIGSENDEVWRNFDRLDSRFDKRITDDVEALYREIENVQDVVNKD